MKLKVQFFLSFANSLKELEIQEIKKEVYIKNIYIYKI